MSETVFVAIGRNEGERLQRCLLSLHQVSSRVVYVDSGSTDGSREFARSIGSEVVELDTSQGFTMARARNAGWREIIARWPDTRSIHFIDGDCELIDGWLVRATGFLAKNPGVAAVCGRRRERYPGASVFNRLCETEWNTPVGEADACGGDALFRREVLEDLGGFDESLIAGEEPELCLRMRLGGWKIWRIDADMTRHDANITRWNQWWKRCVRGGYGAADVALRTADRAGGPLFAGQVRSAVRWTGAMTAGCAGVIVVAALVGVFAGPAIGLGIGVLGFAAIVGIVFSQAARIASKNRKRAGGWRTAAEYGLWTLLAKLPQTLGVLRHRADLKAQRTARIIEYKQ